MSIFEIKTWIGVRMCKPLEKIRIRRSQFVVEMQRFKVEIGAAWVDGAERVCHDR